jgi:hypothetical protein
MLYFLLPWGLAPPGDTAAVLFSALQLEKRRGGQPMTFIEFCQRAPWLQASAQ